MKKNLYAGLARSASESTGEVLTLKSFNKMVKHITSKKFQKQEHERLRFRAMGEIIAGKALSMGLIDLQEYGHLMVTISINGGLIISKRMYDKILPAVEAVEKDLDSKE